MPPGSYSAQVGANVFAADAEKGPAMGDFMLVK
jgi:hypothetical protein